MKMKIETKAGKKGELESATMPELVEAGRKFCLSHNEGWPTDVAVWERVEEKPAKQGRNSR